MHAVVHEPRFGGAVAYWPGQNWNHLEADKALEVDLASLGFALLSIFVFPLPSR